MAGGHLLSRPWLCRVCPIKMYLLEPRQQEKAMSAQGTAHPMSWAGQSIYPAHHTDQVLTAVLVPCEVCQSRGMGCSPRRASLMSSLQMWQGANGIVKVRRLKGRHSGVKNIRQVQTANVMSRSLQKLGNEEMIVCGFILSHHKQWHRAPTQDRAYQGLVLGNQQGQNFKNYLNK